MDSTGLIISYRMPIRFTLNLGFTRSWFQTPNSYDMQNATAWNGLVVDDGGLDPNGNLVGPSDQRSQIKTFNIAPSWQHLIGSTAVFTLGGFVRRDAYNYYPSANPFADFAPDLQSETVGQNRTLLNAGLRSNLSYVKGIHNVKAGVTYEQTFLDEHDRLGIVDPIFLGSLTDANGDPCLDNNGNPFESPCTDLAPYDLTRGGTLFPFNGHTDVKELALYLQDSITKATGISISGFAATSTMDLLPTKKLNHASVSPITSSRRIPCFAFPTLVPWKVPSTRIWCSPVSVAVTLY